MGEYGDGTWIECRKRIYLYWYKFLSMQKSSEHKTGRNMILGVEKCSHEYEV